MPKKLAKHKAKYDLSNLDLDFISLVPSGDDTRANVVLAKAGSDKSTTGAESTSTLSTSDTSEGDVMGKTTQKSRDDDIEEEFDDDESDDDDDEVGKDDLPDEVIKYIEALEDEVDDLSDQVEKAGKRKGKKKKKVPSQFRDDEDDEDDEDESGVGKSGDDSFDEVLSKADPAVRDLIQKMQGDLTEAEKIAKAERDERLRRDYVAKAEQLPMISENKDDLGELMKSLHEKAPEEAATVEKLLTAANKQITESNLFDEIGKSGTGFTLGSSVEAAADAVQKADPDMSREQAIAKAYEDNPALYDEYMKES